MMIKFKLLFLKSFEKWSNHVQRDASFNKINLYFILFIFKYFILNIYYLYDQWLIIDDIIFIVGTNDEYRILNRNKIAKPNPNEPFNGFFIIKLLII